MEARQRLCFSERSLVPVCMCCCASSTGSFVRVLIYQKLVKESTYLTRCKAVAQFEAGKNQLEVARGIGVSIRTVKRWWKKHQTGQELTKTPGRGRKPKL